MILKLYKDLLYEFQFIARHMKLGDEISVPGMEWFTTDEVLNRKCSFKFDGKYTYIVFKTPAQWVHSDVKTYKLGINYPEIDLQMFFDEDYCFGLLSLYSIDELENIISYHLFNEYIVPLNCHGLIIGNIELPERLNYYSGVSELIGG